MSTMIADEDKTPPIVTFASDVLKATHNTPMPHRTPPPGRPPGALTISEMIDKITKEVSQRARDEIARANAELRAEMTAASRTAVGIAILALAMNALVVVAVVAFARRTPGVLVGFTLGSLAVFATGLIAGARRAGSRSDGRGLADSAATTEAARDGRTHALARSAHAIWSGSESGA